MSNCIYIYEWWAHKYNSFSIFTHGVAQNLWLRAIGSRADQFGIKVWSSWSHRAGTQRGCTHSWPCLLPEDNDCWRLNPQVHRTLCRWKVQIELPKNNTSRNFHRPAKRRRKIHEKKIEFKLEWWCDKRIWRSFRGRLEQNKSILWK